MELRALSLSDVELARQWRNQQTEMLRTPFFLTKEQQEKFYYDVVCNRQANARYWGIWEKVKSSETMCVLSNEQVYFGSEKEVNVFKLIGMCGIENIQWENRLGEISLVLNSEYAIDKYGEEALKLLLREGFMNLNLENIYTEVYEISPNKEFWIGLAEEFGINGYCFRLPSRKYYNGKYHQSYYINFDKGAYLEHENTVS